jgi:hypothetical protein
MRGRRPAIGCDADDGCCGNWDLDYWTENASTVNGVRITEAQRAPGWTVTADGDDLCPEHSSPAPAVTAVPAEPATDHVANYSKSREGWGYDWWCSCGATGNSTTASAAEWDIAAHAAVPADPNSED